MDQPKRRGGRRKEFEASLRLPLSAEMLADLDRVVGAEESRLDVIREAIAREVRRRDRAAAR